MGLQNGGTAGQRACSKIIVHILECRSTWHTQLCLAHSALLGTLSSAWHTQLCQAHSALLGTLSSAWHTQLCQAHSALLGMLSSAWHTQLCLAHSALLSAPACAALTLYLARRGIDDLCAAGNVCAALMCAAGQSLRSAHVCWGQCLRSAHVCRGAGQFVHPSSLSLHTYINLPPHAPHAIRILHALHHAGTILGSGQEWFGGVAGGAGSRGGRSA